MKKLASLAILIALCAVLLNPPESDACGPFFPEAQFGIIHQPPLDTFAGGHLGIVKPEYYRKYLVIAYRYLSGAALTPAEIAALSNEPTAANPAKSWLDARNAVPGLQPVSNLDPYRSFVRGQDYINFANCLADAFDSAAATLADRMKQWGPASASTRNWIAGQDAVFANCGGNPPPALPDAAPASADALLKSDRQYQRAAALFYAMQYDDAEHAFQDLNQPYLAARALLRKASVGGDSESYLKAETLLRSVIADPAQRRWHDPARGLLQFIDARNRPMERLDELAASLSKADPHIASDLADFTYIWDHNESNLRPTSDLGDWIKAFQHRDSPHAVERWLVTKSSAWLVAALASAGPKDTGLTELIAAAHRIGPRDPAYATAIYYGIRLSPPDDSRKWATEILGGAIDTELANALHAERLKTAHNWKEVLADAARIPVAVTTDIDDDHADDTQPVFGADAAIIFNGKAKLEDWIEATKSPLLPARLQSLVAQTAWTRAVLANRLADAAVLAARANFQVGGSTHFDAVFFMLRNPGVTPLLRPGYFRREAIAELDAFRDNWWDSKPSDAGDMPAAAFNGPNYLCAETLAWAKLHPEEPRIAEALHLAVRTTRYGPTDKDTTTHSKACFQLLHSKYPSSKWAALTKYWY